jgi:serine/threonine protein kinase
MFFFQKRTSHAQFVFSSANSALASVWHGDYILDAIRGFASTEALPSSVQSNTAPRQEVISVSVFKWTLSQYEHFGELARATADVFRGESSTRPVASDKHAHGNPAVKWLIGPNIVHRDISDGNILLARETLSTFSKPKEVNLALCSNE